MKKVFYILLIHFILLLGFTSILVFKKKEYKVVVGLSTIPDREDKVVKSIDSLLSQTYKPEKIILTICKKYKRFPDKRFDKTVLDKYKDNDLLIINEIDNDYGPISKLFGILDYYENNNIKLKNTMILICDDDVMYKTDMIERFYNRFILNSKRCYSFYVSHNYANNCNVAFGADGIAVSANKLGNIKSFYQKCIEYDPRLFYHDDLVISKYLSIKNCEIVKLSYKNYGLVYIPVFGNVHSLNGLMDELSRYSLNRIKIPKFTL